MTQEQHNTVNLAFPLLDTVQIVRDVVFRYFPVMSIESLHQALNPLVGDFSLIPPIVVHRQYFLLRFKLLQYLCDLGEVVLAPECKEMFAIHNWSGESCANMHKI